MRQNINRSASERLLAIGKLGPLFTRYAIPGAVGLVFFSLQSIVDGIIVGNVVGADALAGVSIVMPSYTALTSVALIIGIGMQAQMNINMGRGDYAIAKSSFKTGLISIAVFAALFAVLINVFATGIAGALGAGAELMDYSVNYIHGVMPFVMAIACFYFFDYALKALGHPRFAMIVMVGSILLNICLSLLFVVKMRMGTFGVGLGTGISMTAGMIASATVVFRQFKRNANLDMARGHFNWRLLGRIFYNGSSEGVSEIAMGITLFLFNITLMKYAGKEGVAAFSVINYIIFIGTSIFLGIADGVIPIASYNYGARLWPRVRGLVKIAVKTNFIIGIIFLALLWIAGGPIISMFLDPSETEVIAMATMGARIMGIGFLVNGFNIYAASFFTSIDNAKLSLVIASLRGLVFILIGILILPRLFGVNGIWMTIPFAEFMTVIASFLLIRKTMAKMR